MDRDTMEHIARQIRQLWTESGGRGPGHAFDTHRWKEGAARIQYEHQLTPEQWSVAQHLAASMETGRKQVEGA